jgi:hypothetical protein
MNPSFSHHNDKSNRDVDWARFGLRNQDVSSQQQQPNGSNRTDRLPGATDFGSEYHYGPGGHQASEVNELFAEEQVPVLNVAISYIYNPTADIFQNTPFTRVHNHQLCRPLYRY